MLGIDHCGHTFGQKHPEMIRKLNELNSFIKHIVSKLQSSDILFILGDHGMTQSGDHGGDSNAELEAALIVFTADQGSLTIKNDSKKQTNKRLSQIDLVPTLSLLTNVPIPYSNLGILSNDLLVNGANLHQGMVLNFIQMFTYTANYFYNISKLPLSPMLFSYMNRIKESSSYDWVEQLNDVELVNILKELQSIFRVNWTQFNELRIFLGILLTSFSLITLALSIEKIYNIHDLNISNICLLFACLLSFLCMNVCYSKILLYFIILLLLILPCIIYVSNNFSKLLLLLLSNFNNIFNGNFVSFILLLLFSTSYLSNSIIIYEFHVTFFLIQSINIMFLVYSFISMYRVPDVTSYSINHIGLKFFRIFSFLPHLSCMVLLLLGLLLWFRLYIRHFSVCREEISFRTSCRSTLDPWIAKPLSKLNPINEFNPVGVVRVTVAILMLITFLYIYWRLLFDYQKLFIGINQLNKISWRKFSLFILIGSLFSLLWMVDSAESNNWIGFIRKHNLHTIRIWIARILLIIIFYVFFQLVKCPFHFVQQIQFINSIQSNHCKQWIERILLNLYTLWSMTCFTILPLLSLLIFLNEFHIIWLVFYTIFIQIFTHRNLKKCNHMNQCMESPLLLYVPQNHISWIFAVFLCLLDNLSFFITGHQPTLSGIPWDAAYAAYEGDHSTRWLPGLTVLLHLYSGPILIALSLPIVIILSIFHQHIHGKMTHSHFNNSQNTGFYEFVDALDLFIWRFIISKSILTLGCMLSTGILRRHLMVWKIFAPRLLFSILSLLISVVCLPLIRFLVVCCLHKRICKILENNIHVYCTS
ncbi:unnamed protein product [Schistosoma turkestanicum]|nr:unnamed protein product [Schistosoma turkestanicum]